MKIYVTKYALTRGILEEDGKPVENNMAVVAHGHSMPSYYHSGEWYRNREPAVIRAEGMRLKKISSLKRSLVKMESLSFT